MQAKEKKHATPRRDEEKDQARVDQPAKGPVNEETSRQRPHPSEPKKGPVKPGAGMAADLDKAPSKRVGDADDA